MKTTTMEKAVIMTAAKVREAHPVRIAKMGAVRKSVAAAADRQIAEVERTFTLRYEW
jgi:hypothetical protein